MKNSFKFISTILIVAIMLATTFLTALPVAAENEDTGTYISALSGFVLTKEDFKDTWSMENVDFQKNVNMLAERGYSALQFDFNKKGYNKSNYIIETDEHAYWFAPFALGYQTTADKSDAITGIVIWYGENPDATIESKGITYNLMGGWEFEDEIVQVDGLDFNRFTHGEYIYLYYTKDAKAGEPIMALKGSDTDTESGYECVRNVSQGNTADLNSGSEMENDCAVYLHIQREAATTGSIFGDGDSTLLIVIIAAVVVVGVGLGVFLTMKKKSSAK